jgi:putative flippase GtrA
MPRARRELLSVGWDVPDRAADIARAAQRSSVARVSMFGIISVITTAVDFGLFNILVAADYAGPVLANVISYGAGVAVSYTLNKRYTFSGGGRDKVSEEFGMFVGFNVVALVLNTAAVAAVAAVVGENALLLNIAKLVSGAAIVALKYVAFQRWVYPRAEARRS